MPGGIGEEGGRGARVPLCVGESPEDKRFRRRRRFVPGDAGRPPHARASGRKYDGSIDSLGLQLRVLDPGPAKGI